MGKFIVEKHNGESILRLYKNEYGYIAGEEAYLTLYTEPDLEQIRKEAYNDGYKKCLSEHDFDSPCVSCDEYKRGLTDAWEAARKICSSDRMTPDMLKAIFGRSLSESVMCRFAAAEAIEKLKAYEQETIQVGDEVISPDGKAVVTEINDRIVRIMYSNGSGYVTQLKELTRTGRHFPEIAAILEKMRSNT